MTKKRKNPSYKLVNHSAETYKYRTVEVSSDKRRKKLHTVTAQVEAEAIPLLCHVDHPSDISFDIDRDPPCQNIVDEVPGIQVVASARTKRYTSTVSKTYITSSDRSSSALQVAPLLIWKQHRSEYLDETLQLDGRGSSSGGVCSDCVGEAGIFRCRDCAGGELLCRTCVCSRHRLLSLHVIEVCSCTNCVETSLMTCQVWRETHFEKTSLQEVGLEVQLGHNPGDKCGNFSLRELVVLHVNGIHKVNVRFCHCGSGVEHRQQLMRHAWWPATVTDPQTCATMELLRTFQALNLQGNISAYDYYLALENLTDSWHVSKIPVSILSLHGTAF